MNKIEQRINSVYVHIPFCQHICNYCDFNKVFLKGQPVDEYINMLLKEIDIYIGKSIHIDTLYIGGGSPSVLNEFQLEKLLSGLYDRFKFGKNYEFTIEVNPGDMTKEKVNLFSDYGVNRVSLGVQSFDDDLLKLLGRTHRRKDIELTIDILRLDSITNISMDLMYALPTQTLRVFKQTLEQALTFDLPHYSIYSLILEEKTVFNNLVNKNKLKTVDNSLEADMYDLAIQMMSDGSKSQYEISNFSNIGFESKHNLVYWNNEEYYGFGAGASGYVGGKRYKNHGPIQHYMKPLKNNCVPVLLSDALSQKEKIEEEMFLGLRKSKGVSLTHFKKKFGSSVYEFYEEEISKLINEGLLIKNDDFICLTDDGKRVGNDVFEAFLFDE